MMDGDQVGQATPALEFVDGPTLRKNPVAEAASLQKRIDQGTAIIAQNYLSDTEVRSLRDEGGKLAARKPPEWSPYYQGCDDFHHFDHNTPEDDKRRRAEKRALRPRQFHLFKFLPWNKHTTEFDAAVAGVVALRNAFYGLPPAFGRQVEDGVFNVPQLVFYGRGGDFLGAHSDADFHIRQGLSTRVEIITLLSRKGDDFEDGGLFIGEDEGRVFVEDIAGPGDLVLYDVKRVHGCAPVDSHRMNDPDALLGRWILLVPPYAVDKHLKSRR